ncbi:MAG: (d)CMP kinase [Bacteroidetes bacterium]|nr:(d)CMP kinase [Bacteroidota bacterium]
MSKITIAIDGYSSCGKSTLAKALAAKLGYAYVDSGAMYRCVTLYALRNGLIKDNSFIEDEIIKTLSEINLKFEFNPFTKSSDTFLNNENVEKDIRQMIVSENVSKVSAIKAVRTKMIMIQRELGKNGGIVMDGRDIGTNVFPNADLKLFMTADPDIRTQRRLDELTSKGQHPTFLEVKQNLLSRDHEDTHRKENPLTQAKDAIVLDNSDLTREQQLDFVLKLIHDLTLKVN